MFGTPEFVPHITFLDKSFVKFSRDIYRQLLASSEIINILNSCLNLSTMFFLWYIYAIFSIIYIVIFHTAKFFMLIYVNFMNSDFKFPYIFENGP